MTTQPSTFLADKFIQLGQYQELQKQFQEKCTQFDEAIMRLGESCRRVHAAEKTLIALRYKRAEDGTWFNSDL